MTMKMLFLGMNRISTSLGLVLNNSDKDIDRVGYDPDVTNVKTGIEMGAVDHSTDSLQDGVKDAEVIFYALPAGNMQEIINSIRQDIKSGCFLISMNPIGHDTFSLMAKILPDPNAFIAWYPAINPKYMLDEEYGPRGAHDDLFQNSHIYIAGEVNTHPEAIKLGSDLATLAGSLPLNIEPEELAGILALSYDLPLIVSAIATGMVTNQPGWNEARKLAGGIFTRFSSLLDSAETQAVSTSQLLSNRRNIQRLLSQIIDELTTIHTELDDIESKAAGQAIRNAAMARRIWHKQRTTMSWLDIDQVKPEAPPSLGEKLLGKRRK